jgi:hypothetical protein
VRWRSRCNLVEVELAAARSMAARKFRGINADSFGGQRPSLRAADALGELRQTCYLHLTAPRAEPGIPQRDSARCKAYRRCWRSTD